MPDRAVSCFVLMPFKLGEDSQGGVNQANFVYKHIITPAVEKAFAATGLKFELHREVDSNITGAINRNIIRQIAASDIAIVDITGRNPNVFFELGVRYALKKRITILMHQQNTIIPFDIRNYRSVEYDPFSDDAIEKLTAAIRDAQLAPHDHSDSLVYEVFPHITVDITSSTDAPMPWSLYWERFKSVTERLQKAKISGAYRPDVLVGITNGGAIFADLLEREVEYTCPITSLWARRDAVKYFENPINAALLDGIRESVKQKSSSEVRLLLLDDIVARGNTFRQAYSFIKEYAPEWHVRFLPLMYKEERNYRTLITGGSNEQHLNRILWKHPKLALDDESIHEMHMVKWRTLPYEKEIAS